MLRLSVLGLAVLALITIGQLRAPPSTQALFHFAVIDEVMTSYDGDADVQFVEIKMLTSAQNLVRNSVLGAFDADGNFIGDVLVVPGNVANSGTNVRWLMATADFATVSGLTPDFVMPAGLPTGGGMVCWGAPGVLPPNPATWDHSNPLNYVDCLAYGDYNGPGNLLIGTNPGDFPAPNDADGHSLQRVSETNRNAVDFVCSEAATPTKNDGASASLPATTPCAPPPAPTCLGLPATIVGTEGPDVLIGTAGNDVIVALGGNDLIFAGGGNDIICAGDGDDIVFGGPGNDILLGEDGNDILIGGADFDICVGGPGTDTAFGCELTFGVP